MTCIACITYTLNLKIINSDQKLCILFKEMPLQEEIVF